MSTETKQYGCPASVKIQGLRFGYRKCTKPIWKDGYCKIHHPDSVRERDERSRERFNEEMRNSPMARLKKAQETISQQAQTLELAKKALKEYADSSNWRRNDRFDPSGGSFEGISFAEEALDAIERIEPAPN